MHFRGGKDEASRNAAFCLRLPKGKGLTSVTKGSGMREKGVESRSVVSAPICVILVVIITLIYNHFLYARYWAKSTLHAVFLPDIH